MSNAASLTSPGPFHSPNQASVFEALRSTPLMRDLSDAVLDRLAAITKMVDWPENNEICAQGDLADELFIVLNGQLVGFSSTAHGSTTVVEVIRSGGTLGLATVLARLPRMIGVRSVTACRLLAIEGLGLLALVEQSPALVTVLLRAEANEFHALVRQVCDFKLRTAPQRLGCYLLSLTSGGPANATALRLPFDKRLLAARLGCRQENLSRAFATLREFGVETHGARVILRDIAKLQAFSEADPVSCD